MAQCLFCHKDLVQTDGKKAKHFCNNTCRSNYWYGKNKKGKPKEVVTMEKKSGIKFLKKKKYDAPRLDNYTEDEFPKTSQPKSGSDYLTKRRNSKLGIKD